MALHQRVVMAIGIGGLAVAAIGLGYGVGRGLRHPAATPTRPPGSAPALPSAAVAPATKSSDDPAQALLATAEQALVHEQWLEARKTLQQILKEHPDTPAAIEAQQRLGEADIHLLFSPNPDPSTPFYSTYVVQAGDSLSKIARQHHTTIELLQLANHLTGDKILVGRSLRVPKVTFSIVVNKSQNTLTLKANEEVVKVYAVSTGKEDQTPVGTFTIVNKLVDPPWYTPQGVIPYGSAQNILGTRWMGFSKPSYGIHGTTDPATIGQSVTAGCVRMRNPDVEELYTLLPLGTDVTIVD